MTSDDIRRVAYQNPFRPFRVRLVSGELLEIKRSLRTSVAEDRVVFGVDEDSQRGVATRMRIVPLRDIAAVEVLARSSD